MNIFSRILLSFLAIAGVGALGYYAYTLTSQTLTLPFAFSEEQYGDTLELVVAPPSFQITKRSDVLLDSAAIRSSLVRDDVSVAPEILASEYSVDITNAYIRIEYTKKDKKISAPLTLSSTLYNKHRTTPYRLPKDITLIPTDVPKDVSIDREGDPRDQIYNITLYGPGEYNPDQMRYYVHYDASLDCRIASWGAPRSSAVSPLVPLYQTPTVSGEVPLVPVIATPWVYTPLPIETLTPSSRDGQKWISQVKLPYDLSKSRICIIAGVGGQYRVVEDRVIDEFSITGSLLQTLSPEYDMKSQIEFRFSHDIYSDVGTLYSAEYISHRKDAKIDFLKSFDISPHIDITPDDLILTPGRAILTLPLKEGQKYTFTIRDLSDVYGRKSSYTLDALLKSEPFLSMRLVEDKHVYKPDEPIQAKLYTLLPPKNTYTLKLCRVNLDVYARIERILEDTSRASNATITSLLSSSEVSDCREKDIVLKSKGYVSPFTIDDFFTSKTKKTGMYILSFSKGEDTAKYGKFITPIVFSVVDTHLILKVDASGKMMILATDITTGNPLPDQEITLLRNISRTHTEKWDPNTGRTDKIYLPLTTQSFATGIVIGKTDGEGYIDKKVDTLPGIDGYDASPYGLAFENWWEYEGRYDSFLVSSRGGDRFGFLVSTWNDGITGYNFGMKDSDYSYSTRPEYTGYIHTDRRLYLRGEKVHIHSIIRKNVASLTLPPDTPFDIVISDPLGREVKRSSMKANEFGSLFTDFDLGEDTLLGAYTVNITSQNTSEYIENGMTTFQVEVFKNPTFTATIDLKSPDIEDGILRGLRKLQNTDPYNPWYNDVYKGEFTLEGIVKAKYYNGADIKNTPFTYRVYRSDAFGEDYFTDCFWGCYYEPQIEQYSEGSGSIDDEGYGIIRIPVEFSSFYSDYKYTVEVTIRDVLTGEEVTTPSSLTVKLPAEYKSFSPENPLIFMPKKKILSPGEGLTGEVKPTYGKWESSLAGKYHYEIIRREYTEAYVDDIRAGALRISSPQDSIVMSGSITKKDFSEKLLGLKAGEYHMKISPIVTSGEAPESSISDTLFYISGNSSSLQTNTLRVIPERTVYKAGETARVMIEVPFTHSHLLITKEKGGVIDREYIYLSGNTLTREYPIDDTLLPNAYIGVVALHSNTLSGSSRTYAVGYGEIVTDIAYKKSLVTIKTDKTTYKNRDTVTTDLTLTDRSGNPLQGEVTFMVVDESLIRLMGNIDLDIIPKFYQKFPFTMKTALSAIGIERNRFLSRKGSNGGSGDKGGDGAQISSRTLFQNTAFYSPSVRTDLSGKARVTFTLPDTITDYRIIAIAGTRDSRFGVAEKTIEVRKDYVIEAATPTILRTGDTFTITASVSNHTKKITPTELLLTIGTGSTKIEKKTSLSLDALDRKGYNFSLQVPSGWKDKVSYTLELREKDTLLDSITQTLIVPSLPIITEKSRNIDIFTGSSYKYSVPKSILANGDDASSTIDVRVSTNYADFISQGVASLLQYPYGCIEQTISSTLADRLALSLAESLGSTIDKVKAREYTKKGLEKILRMQHFSGGWVYWEGAYEPSAPITPYVLRSLLQFRNLGEQVPQEVFQNGLNYIVNNEAEYSAHPDSYAEAVWTLATFKDTHAPLWWSRIDPMKLSRHGYLAYAYAAQKLGKYTGDIDKLLVAFLEKNDDSWYWSRYADQALFAQLLIERKETERALKVVDTLVRSIDLTSYYVSTQEKIQSLIALTDLTRTQAKLTTTVPMALRSEKLIADLPLSPSKTSNTLSTTREKIGASYTIRRDITKVPFFVTTLIQDRPREITDMMSYSTGGIMIHRLFELVDESKGIDANGEFRVTTPGENGIFQKGKLYKVTLKINVGLTYGSHHLNVEDFFPGGWRPINGKLKTESSMMNVSDNVMWSYVETKADRLLVNREYVTEGEPLTYSYYIRPESVGEYLLPPATAYLMYRPEIHAYTKYERVKVVQ